jgi:hypothetical protein
MAEEIQLAVLHPTETSNQSQPSAGSSLKTYRLESHNCCIEPGGVEEVNMTDVRIGGLGEQGMYLV